VIRQAVKGSQDASMGIQLFFPRF